DVAGRGLGDRLAGPELVRKAAGGLLGGAIGGEGGAVVSTAWEGGVWDPEVFALAAAAGAGTGALGGAAHHGMRLIHAMESPTSALARKGLDAATVHGRETRSAPEPDRLSPDLTTPRQQPRAVATEGEAPKDHQAPLPAAEPPTATQRRYPLGHPGREPGWDEHVRTARSRPLVQHVTHITDTALDAWWNALPRRHRDRLLTAVNNTADPAPLPGETPDALRHFTRRAALAGDLAARGLYDLGQHRFTTETPTLPPTTPPTHIDHAYREAFHRGASLFAVSENRLRVGLFGAGPDHPEHPEHSTHPHDATAIAGPSHTTPTPTSGDTAAGPSQPRSGTSTEPGHPGHSGPDPMRTDPLPGRVPTEALGSGPSVHELVAHLHHKAQEAGTPDSVTITPATLGPDLFGRRTPAPTRDFLVGHDYHGLSPEQTLCLYDKLDLLAPTPQHHEMDPNSWDLSAYHDKVVRPRPGRRYLTDWAPRSGDAPLPERVLQGIPKISYSIWFGSVLRPEGHSKLFWERLAESTRRNPDLTFVHLTEITREEVRTALAQHTRPDDARQSDIWDLAHWAKDHGIRLVNVHERYHHGQPMIAHDAFLDRLNHHNGPGYAAASDIVRLNLLEGGGLYLDGNKLLLPDGNVFQDVAESDAGFSYTREAGNGGFLTLPGHPFFRTLLDNVVAAYAKDEPGLFRDSAAYQGHRSLWNLNLRSPVVELAGPFAVRRTLISFGWYLVDENHPFGLTRDPKPQQLKHDDSHQGSWLISSEPARHQLRPDEIPGLVADTVQVLVNSIANTRGTLDLVGIEALVKSLPDPHSALEAALTYIASHEDLRTRVTGFFGTHWKELTPDGKRTKMTELTDFSLLDVAKRFLYPVDLPQLIGDENGLWLCDKIATRAVLLAPGTHEPGPEDLARARAATRPDDFGLHRQPTDPWPDHLTAEAKRHLSGAGLGADEHELARQAIDFVARNDGSSLRVQDWHPEHLRSYRQDTARLLGLHYHDPDRPLPFAEEGRLLYTHRVKADYGITLPQIRPAVFAAATRAVAHALSMDAPARHTTLSNQHEHRAEHRAEQVSPSAPALPAHPVNPSKSHNSPTPAGSSKPSRQAGGKTPLHSDPIWAARISRARQHPRVRTVNALTDEEIAAWWELLPPTAANRLGILANNAADFTRLQPGTGDSLPLRRRLMFAGAFSLLSMWKPDEAISTTDLLRGVHELTP
ncbi:hypothetical protein AB0O11_39155, partial [Kitasatospora sp. NPDC093102]